MFRNLPNIFPQKKSLSCDILFDRFVNTNTTEGFLLFFKNKEAETIFSNQIILNNINLFFEKVLRLVTLNLTPVIKKMWLLSPLLKAIVKDYTNIPLSNNNFDQTKWVSTITILLRCTREAIDLKLLTPIIIKQYMGYRNANGEFLAAVDAICASGRINFIHLILDTHWRQESKEIIGYVIDKIILTRFNEVNRRLFKMLMEENLLTWWLNNSISFEILINQKIPLLLDAKIPSTYDFIYHCKFNNPLMAMPELRSLLVVYILENSARIHPFLIRAPIDLIAKVLNEIYAICNNGFEGYHYDSYTKFIDEIDDPKRDQIKKMLLSEGQNFTQPFNYLAMTPTITQPLILQNRGFSNAELSIPSYEEMQLFRSQCLKTDQQLALNIFESPEYDASNRPADISITDLSTTDRDNADLKVSPKSIFSNNPNNREDYNSGNGCRVS